MINGTRYIGYCCAVVFAVSVLAVRDGVAQTKTTMAPAAAITLEKQANAWLGFPKKWAGVARSLERAAEIRGADDAQAVQDLFLAAAARISVGQRTEAQAAFTKAAEWSLANGDVATAANGYTRAAVAAFENKDLISARQLRDKAARLTHSPLLNAVQRQAILGQFMPPKTSIAADTD